MGSVEPRYALEPVSRNKTRRYYVQPTSLHYILYTCIYKYVCVCVYFLLQIVIVTRHFWRTKTNTNQYTFIHSFIREVKFYPHFVNDAHTVKVCVCVGVRACVWMGWLDHYLAMPPPSFHHVYFGRLSKDRRLPAAAESVRRKTLSCGRASYCYCRNDCSFFSLTSTVTWMHV